jgi:hypothetical protein
MENSKYLPALGIEPIMCAENNVTKDKLAECRVTGKFPFWAN